jgi:hypothetical protein
MGLPMTPQPTPPASTMPRLRTIPQPKPTERKDSQEAFMDMYVLQHTRYWLSVPSQVGIPTFNLISDLHFLGSKAPL